MLSADARSLAAAPRLLASVQLTVSFLDTVSSIFLLPVNGPIKTVRKLLLFGSAIASCNISGERTAPTRSSRASIASTPVNEPRPRRPRYSHGSCREALCNCKAPALSSNLRHLLISGFPPFDFLLDNDEYGFVRENFPAAAALAEPRASPLCAPLPCPRRSPSSDTRDFSGSGIAHLLRREARWEWTLRVTAVSLPAKEKNRLQVSHMPATARSILLCKTT